MPWGAYSASQASNSPLSSNLASRSRNSSISRRVSYGNVMLSLGQVIDPGLKLHPHRQFACHAADAAVAVALVVVETAREIDPRAGLLDQSLLTPLQHFHIVGKNHRGGRADRGQKPDGAVKHF